MWNQIAKSTYIINLFSDAWSQQKIVLCLFGIVIFDVRGQDKCTKMGAQYCFFFPKIFTSSSGQTYCFPTWIRYEYGILEVCNVACVQGCPVFMPSCLNVNTSHWAIYSGRLTESFGICTSSRASCSGRFGYVVALRPMYLVFVVSSEQILRHCNRQVIDVPACFYNLSLSHSTM